MASAGSKRKAPTDDETATAAAASSGSAAGAVDSKHNGASATAVADPATENGDAEGSAAYEGVKKPRTAGPDRPDSDTTVVVPQNTEKAAPLTSSGAIVPTAGLPTGGGALIHIPENHGQVIVAKVSQCMQAGERRRHRRRYSTARRGARSSERRAFVNCN